MLKEQIKVLEDALVSQIDPDRDINPLLEDTEEEKKVETEDEHSEEGEQGETDEDELTNSSYSDNMDSPEAPPEEPDVGEDSDVPADVEDLIAGLSPRTSSRCSSRSRSRSSSPSPPRAWSPTDSTIECKVVCGSRCQLPAHLSDRHLASIPPILDFPDFPSSDSDCSIKIIWETK